MFKKTSSISNAFRITSMASTQNQAAWLTTPKLRPFKVGHADMPVPAADEILIRNRAVAMNPIDWKQQKFDMMVPVYPWVLGRDSAGEVVAVGSEVTDFKPGDRVLACMDGFRVGKASNEAFQLYACTGTPLASKIPDSMDFARAAVLPLAITTAAAGLFEKDKLGLQYPVAKGNQEWNGEWVFVYGGSSSVGTSAIMLAKAAGYKVAATSSPRNSASVKSVGADEVFDHYDESLAKNVASKLSREKFAGFYESIGDKETVMKTGLVALELSGRRAVTTVMPRCDQSWVPEGVELSGIFASDIAGNEVGPMVFHEFLPGALASGTIQAKPDPLVIGKGLDKIQEACDKLAAGVSGQKIVVEL